MLDPPFQIPAEVIDWVRDVFAKVNQRVSAKLARIPTTHETSLDITLIEELSQYAAAFRFPSRWLVRLETHYLGGGRYWGKWEIADIGVLIIFRRGGVTKKTKIALLQSKRLYPTEAQAPSEDHRIDYIVGFGRLLPAEQEYKSSVKQRHFNFTEESQYRAFEYRSEQYTAILSYTSKNDVPVHYLLYNPSSLPLQVTLPVEAGHASPAGGHLVGCRIIDAGELDQQLKAAKLKKGDNPAYRQIFRKDQDETIAPWPLEYFVADLVLKCREGYQAGVNPIENEALFTVFNRRSGPISAAIAITIDAPLKPGRN